MSENKKPFKDTKFWKFVTEKIKPVAGDVLEIVGDVTGIGAIEKVGELLNDRKENDVQVQALAIEFELKKLEFELEFQKIEIEQFKAEVQDRESARNMRNEFTRAGKIDWEHFVVNMIGLSLFLFVVIYLLYRTVPADNRELVIHILGIIEGVVLSIFAFHNGTTRGSRMKDETIRKMK
jgi:hypothetical protein